MSRRASAWRCAAAALLCSVLLAAAHAQDVEPADVAGVLARQPAGPEDLVAPSMRAGEAPASRHLFSLAPLMGPFAERAASLQADASAAADAAAAAARAAVQASKARIEARSSKSSKNSLEGGGKAVQSAPRRALLQDINTEAVLTALIILIFDFFLGFYTGYLKGFFT